MNKLITTIIIGLVAIASFAQNAADIEVGYLAHSPNFKKGKVDVTNSYILLANTSQSKFLSPTTEYIDSINSTPEGAAKWQDMARSAILGGKIKDMPRKDGSYYVVKSFSDSILRYYDNAGVDKYFYDETIGGWSWEISDSTKNILGYECIKATADYHGRIWEVWFAPEIPVSNGPWKLGGLPGLILEASTEGGQYSFIATGIQQTTKPIGSVYLADEYEKTDRLKFLKAKRAFLDNPLGNLNAKLNGEMKISSESLSPLFLSADVVDFIETDYR